MCGGLSVDAFYVESWLKGDLFCFSSVWNACYVEVCVCVCEGQYWGVWSLCVRVSGLPGDHGIFSCVFEQGTHTWRDPDAHRQRFWF